MLSAEPCGFLPVGSPRGAPSSMAEMCRRHSSDREQVTRTSAGAWPESTIRLAKFSPKETAALSFCNKSLLVNMCGQSGITRREQLQYPILNQ